MRRRSRPRRKAGPSPLLILASGQRCGSTLVQRLLSSHPDVMIWGEHGGHLREVLESAGRMRAWNTGLGEPGRRELERSGLDGWVATVLPEPDHNDEAARAFVRALFAEPAAAMGRSVWGFKEVRLGLGDARALRELFPATRVLHLTRDPRAILASLDRWERALDYPREYTRLAIDHWVEVNESFADLDEDLPWLQSWRYEDLLADEDAFLLALAALTGLDPERLDSSVFDRRVSDYIPEESRAPARRYEDLPESLQELLAGERVRAAAARYGYDLS